MAEFPGANDRFVDEYRVFVDQNDHAAIVLHGTGGNPNQTADQLGDFFEVTPAETSVHYGIDRLGNIDQYVLEKDGAAGNGFLDTGYDPFWDQYADNPNWHSLSVETENDSTNSLALTDPQKAVLFRLVAYWVSKYQIPLGNIKGHFTLQPINRALCPGPQFPWDELFAYLKGASMNVPQGWNYNATTGILTAPNKHTAKLGNAQFVLLSPAWDAGNVPLEEEHGVPGGTAQLFRDGELAWDAKNGVHYAPIGLLYQAAEAQITSLQAQITALQKQIAAIPVSITQLANQVAAVLLQLQQYNALISTDIAAAQAVLQAITPSSS